jgi:hypothetical protein
VGGGFFNVNPLFLGILSYFWISSRNNNKRHLHRGKRPHNEFKELIFLAENNDTPTNTFDITNAHTLLMIEGVGAGGAGGGSSLDAGMGGGGGGGAYHRFVGHLPVGTTFEQGSNNDPKEPCF